MEKRLAARRPERRVAGDAGIRSGAFRGEQHIVGNVLQKSGVERGGFFKCQRRHQSGLGAARRRRLGHKGDTAARGLWVVAGASRIYRSIVSHGPSDAPDDRQHLLDDYSANFKAPVTSASHRTSRPTLKSYPLHKLVIVQLRANAIRIVSSFGNAVAFCPCQVGAVAYSPDGISREMICFPSIPVASIGTATGLVNQPNQPNHLL